MIFPNRSAAGKRLARLIEKNRQLEWLKQKPVVVSLLRGGAVVGAALAQILKWPHLPLVVKKIAAPCNPELALGAVCQNVVYLDAKTLSYLQLSTKEIGRQVELAKRKQQDYLRRYHIDQLIYQQLRKQMVFLVDDGIATFATMIAALKFVEQKKPQTVIIAVPVAPKNKPEKLKAEILALKRPITFGAISQFYRDFSQVSDEEIKRIFNFDKES